MNKLVAGWFITALLLLFQGIALAQEETPDDPLVVAKKRYVEGKEHFTNGRFDEAMEAFTKAYNLSGEINLLYNLGALAQQLGDFERAIAYYEVYLEELPDAPDSEEIRTRLEQLKAAIAPEAEKPAQVQTREEAEPKDKKKPSALEAYAEDETGKKPIEVFWPGVAVGAGGLLVAGGVITGILAKKEYDKLKNSCSPHCRDNEIGKAKGLALATDLEFIFGVAAAATGAVFWIMDSRKKDKEDTGTKTAAWRVAPVGFLDGPGLTIQGRF